MKRGNGFVNIYCTFTTELLIARVFSQKYRFSLSCNGGSKDIPNASLLPIAAPPMAKHEDTSILCRFGLFTYAPVVGTGLSAEWSPRITFYSSVAAR